MQTKKELGTAVVTGASSGLGALFAERLAERGYNLKLVARREDRLNALSEKLTAQYGIKVTNLVADLGASADLEKVANDLSADESITLLINNAGTTTLAPIAQTPVAQQKEMIDVNITAVVLLSNAVLPRFVARNEGTLINIASIMALHSFPVSAIYSGSKAFVALYTSGLQQELKDTNVRVQLVNPAGTATEIWDLGGMPLSSLDPATVMTIEDCVDAALSGLDQNETVTFPSVNNQELIDAYQKASLDLFISGQTGKPADRYAKK